MAWRCTPAACPGIRRRTGASHLPSKFAEELFAVSPMGMTVVVVE